MSHFCVLVVGLDVDAQLAPYNEADEEYMEDDPDDVNDDGTPCRSNPNAQWDWYEIGGRWTDMLLNKDGTWCNELCKGDLDLEGMISLHLEEQLRRFDLYSIVFKGKEIPVWNGGDDAARTQYNNDPTIVALREFERIVVKFDETMDLGFGCIHHMFCGGDREKFIEKERREAVLPYAMVVDGEWYQQGSMGWFGISTNENAEWATEFRALLDKVDDDEWLTVVDCHI